MQQITKPYIYKMLHQISEEQSIDVGKYISMTVGCNDIPYEAIVFVNKYTPLDQLSTYNAIYEKRNKSRLFRNIVKDNLSIEDKAVVLSSILNQSLINIKHRDALPREDLVNAVNVELILNALNRYMFESYDEDVADCFEMFRIIFKTLFPK